MLINIEQLDHVCILHCEGRFVAGPDTEYVESKLRDIKSLTCTRVLADFEKVTSLGSIGITFLVETYSSVVKKPEGRFVLVGAGSVVQGVLNLTRLNTVIPQEADLASGLTFLAAHSLAGGDVRK